MTKRQKVFWEVAAKFLTNWCGRNGICEELYDKYDSLSPQDYRYFYNTNWGQPELGYWWPLGKVPDENRAMFCILMATISDEDWNEMTRAEGVSDDS